MSGFGLFWSFAAAAEAHPPWQTLIRAGGLIVTAILVVPSGRMLRRAHDLPGSDRGSDGWRESFLIVTGLEVGGIILAFVVLTAVGMPLLIALVATLIVGLHFFPLAAIFRVRLYALTGVLLLALSLVGILGQTRATVAATSLGAAGVLWLTATVRLATNRDWP